MIPESPLGLWLLRLAGSALAAGPLMAGIASCTVSVGAVQRHSTSYTVGSRVTTLVVRDQAGDVRVIGGHSDAISVTERVSYHGTAPTTTHRTTGDTLSLDSNCQASETCDVDYTISVPRTTSVRVNDGAGTITVDTLDGSLTAHINAGKISLNSLAGTVQATSDAGSIAGRDLSSARASLHVSAGKIEAAFAAAPTALAVTTDVGAITVHVPNSVSYDVTASADVGTVQIRVTRSASAARTIKASTRTGSITIEPPA